VRVWLGLVGVIGDVTCVEGVGCQACKLHGCKNSGSPKKVQKFRKFCSLLHFQRSGALSSFIKIKNSDVGDALMGLFFFGES
jgi:hypothetical protein